MELAKNIAQVSDVLFSELDNESILFKLQIKRYYSLDDVGTRMWQLLSECNNMETVVQQLLMEYDVEVDHLRQELETLIEKLAQAGLLNVEN